MTTRALVDPQLLPLIDGFVLGPLSDQTLPQVRARIAAMVPPPQASSDVPVEVRDVPGEGGESPVRLRIHNPLGAGANAPRPAVLHIHGGGYVMGAAEFGDSAAQTLARALGAVVVSVDYRLAPEHPFPAALDDCRAALGWMHAQAKSLRVDPTRVAVLGESAGGGLAACLAQRARDEGGPPLALQVLAAPMLDDRTGALGPPDSAAGEFLWTAADNRYGWGAYLRGAVAGALPPYAAAARSSDLRGLPPAFICVGALDLFLKEDLAYAARLIAAGVPVEAHVHPGGVHAFELVPGSRIAQTDARDRLDALRRALRG